MVGADYGHWSWYRKRNSPRHLEKLYTQKQGDVVVPNNEISTRLATMEDSRTVWSWRNESLARLMSINSEPISWNDHQNWMRLIIKDKNIILLIAQKDLVDIGVVRFETNKKSTKLTVHINLNPIARSKGLSRNILLSSLKHVKGIRDYNDCTLSAQIKKINEPSIRLFKSLGFKQTKNASGLATYESKLSSIMGCN